MVLFPGSLLVFNSVIYIDLWVVIGNNRLLIVKSCVLVNIIGLNNEHPIVKVWAWFFTRLGRELLLTLKFDKLRRNQLKLFLFPNFLAENRSFPPRIRIGFGLLSKLFLGHPLRLEVFKSEIEKGAAYLVHRWVYWLLYLEGVWVLHWFVGVFTKVCVQDFCRFVYTDHGTEFGAIVFNYQLISLKPNVRVDSWYTNICDFHITFHTSSDLEFIFSRIDHLASIRIPERLNVPITFTQVKNMNNFGWSTFQTF